MKKLLIVLMGIGAILLTFGNGFGIFLMLPFMIVFVTKKVLFS